MKTLILGTRRSKLAMWQAEWVARLLADRGVRVRIEAMASPGDRDRERPLYALGATGVFTKMLEDALLLGRVDLAVHSLKDLPTSLPEGLTVAAVPPRADSRDALVVRDAAWRSLTDLPENAIVGTSSLRRAAQVRAVRPDLKILALRGNVPTRLTKVQEGQDGLSAALLAAAGLQRLGFDERIAAILDPMQVMPAPAQGAVAVEVREGSVAAELLKPIQDEATSVAVRAERAMLARLEGGCHAPVGAFTRTEPDGSRRLFGRVTALDGSRSITREIPIAVDDPEGTGRTLADALLEAGAAELVRVGGSEAT